MPTQKPHIQLVSGQEVLETSESKGYALNAVHLKPVESLPRLKFLIEHGHLEAKQESFAMVMRIRRDEQVHTQIEPIKSKATLFSIERPSFERGLCIRELPIDKPTIGSISEGLSLKRFPIQVNAILLQRQRLLASLPLDYELLQDGDLNLLPTFSCDLGRYAWLTNEDIVKERYELAQISSLALVVTTEGACPSPMLWLKLYPHWSIRFGVFACLTDFLTVR
jgi:hypothetical protein